MNTATPLDLGVIQLRKVSGFAELLNSELLSTLKNFPGDVAFATQAMLSSETFSPFVVVIRDMGVETCAFWENGKNFDPMTKLASLEVNYSGEGCHWFIATLAPYYPDRFSHLDYKFEFIACDPSTARIAIETYEKNKNSVPMFEEEIQNVQ